MPSALQLPLDVRDGEVIVDYLGAGDQPWLRVLIETFDGCVGKRVRDLTERLADPSAFPAPFAKRQAAIGVLRGMFSGVTKSPVAPPRARATLFGEAARHGPMVPVEIITAPQQELALRPFPGPTADDRPPSVQSRTTVIRTAAASLQTGPDHLWRSLFADIPSEREVVAPAEIPSPSDIVLQTNLAIVQKLVRASTRVRIQAEGNVRPLVRTAKLRGLICSVSARDEDDTPQGGSEGGGWRVAGTCLDVSGPLSLFRRTLLYGRALAELVPVLAWCPRFHLEARGVYRGEPGRLVLTTGAPIFPSREPRRYDSKLEERFARDFARLAPDWDLVREPEAFRAGSSLVFPDFLLRHRKDPTRRFFVEIVGFWTREYLDKKLAAMRAIARRDLVLCIDEDRNCAEADLPMLARVVRYRKRVDPVAVLQAIGETIADPGPTTGGPMPE